jgi:hypothetical protein
MKKKWILGLGAVLIVLLFSCADFFTNSWGANLARDPSTITVTAGNVKDLLKEARGDPKASKGILDKITEKIKGNPTSEPVLQTAAVTAANQASGLGTVFLDNVDILLGDDIPDEDTFNALLTKVQNDTKGNNLPGISSDIVAALPVGTAGANNAPVFTGSFGKNVSEADLALLALTLVLAESEKSGGFDSYIESWTNTNGKKIDGTGNVTLSPAEKVIAAAANQITINSPNSDLGKMLTDLFKQTP